MLAGLLAQSVNLIEIDHQELRKPGKRKWVKQRLFTNRAKSRSPKARNSYRRHFSPGGKAS